MQNKTRKPCSLVPNPASAKSRPGKGKSKAKDDDLMTFIRKILSHAKIRSLMKKQTQLVYFVGSLSLAAGIIVSFQNCAPPQLPQDGLTGTDQASQRREPVDLPPALGNRIDDSAPYQAINWEGVCESDPRIEPMARWGAGDGAGILLAFQRSSDSAAAFWNVNSGVLRRGRVCRMLSAGWKVAAVANFDGDFVQDVLWRHTDGRLVLWRMRGSERVGGGPLPWSSDPNAKLIASGDFNADGRSDLLWSHSNGTLSITFMNGVNPPLSSAQITSSESGNPVVVVGSDMELQSVADFTADRNVDILWRNQSTGVLTLWRMSSATIMQSETPKYLNEKGEQQVLDPSHKIISVGDFGGDGKADLMIRLSDSSVVLWKMDAFNNPTGFQFLSRLPTEYRDVLTTVDADGDRKADIFWLYQSNAPSITAWTMADSSATGLRNMNQIGLIDSGWEPFRFEQRLAPQQ